MKIQKLNISFTKYTDANLLTKAEGIYIGMSTDAAFISLATMLTAFKATLDAYSTALNASTERSRSSIAVKKQCRATLEAALQQLAASVMSLANGDVTILIISGFTLSKTPAPVHITNPGAVTLSNGITSGQLCSSVHTVDGASSYFHQITPEPLTDTSHWESSPSTRSRHTFTGLEPGKKYWVRVAVTGPGDEVAYGPASSTYVQ